MSVQCLHRFHYLIPASFTQNHILLLIHVYILLLMWLYFIILFYFYPDSYKQISEMISFILLSL